MFRGIKDRGNADTLQKGNADSVVVDCWESGDSLHAVALVQHPDVRLLQLYSFLRK